MGDRILSFDVSPGFIIPLRKRSSNSSLKMISFRPRGVTIRACLHLCNVRVWTCACAFAIAVEEKEATPRIERECIGCFTAVSKPGDSEWEGRRRGEDKENGCKRFGSWYPRPPGRLKSLRVYFRCLATRAIAEKPQHVTCDVVRKRKIFFLSAGEREFRGVWQLYSPILSRV